MKKIMLVSFLFIMILTNVLCYAESDTLDVFNEFSYVYDFEDIIDDSFEAEIEINNYFLEKACGAQIVIITIDRTNIPIDEYAYEAFNQIRIGDSKLNNGLLLVLAIDDDDYYLIPGGNDKVGIDKLYPQAEIKKDLITFLEKYFAKKMYLQGIKSMFERLFWRASGLYGVDIPYYRIEPVYQN